MQERCIRSMLLVSELLSIYFMNFSKFPHSLVHGFNNITSCSCLNYRFLNFYHVSITDFLLCRILVLLYTKIALNWNQIFHLLVIKMA